MGMSKTEPIGESRSVFCYNDRAGRLDLILAAFLRKQHVDHGCSSID